MVSASTSGAAHSRIKGHEGEHDDQQGQEISRVMNAAVRLVRCAPMHRFSAFGKEGSGDFQADPEVLGLDAARWGADPGVQTLILPFVPSPGTGAVQGMAPVVRLFPDETPGAQIGTPKTSCRK